MFRDPFDVRQAWVRLGDPKEHWLHATIGRQELKYDAQRLVGPLDWTNTARQFGTAKLTIGRDDLSVDVFAASVVRIDEDAFNRRADGTNVHGVYARLDRWAGKGALEAYTFGRLTRVRRLSSAASAMRTSSPAAFTWSEPCLAASTSRPRWRLSSATAPATTSRLGAATGSRALPGN